MRKENILVLVLVCLVLAAAYYFVDGQRGKFSDKEEHIEISGGIQWNEYSKGLELASAQDKPVFLYFHADWCTYCQKLKQTTFADAGVIQALHQDFVPVSVDVDKKRDLARNWNVRGLPMMVFLKPDGSRIGSIPGFVDAGSLMRAVEKVLENSEPK